MNTTASTGRPASAPPDLHALVVSPVAFEPDWEGNRKRVKQIVHLLLAAGVKVHFLFVKHTDGDASRMRAALAGRYSEIDDPRVEGFLQPWYFRMRLARFTKQYSFHNFDVDSWYGPSIDAEVQRLVAEHRIELVVCEYIFYSRLFERLRGITSVIDTHDVFADRYKVLVELGRAPDWFSTPPSGEKKALTRADMVLAIQENDAGVFRGYGHQSVHTLPYLPTGYASALAVRQAADAPLTLCFLGSGNDVNVSALQTYLTDIHPALVKADLNFETQVIGAVCGRFKDRAGEPRLRWLGRIDDLDEALARCDVLVNSVVTGTGLPVKVLDALASGMHTFASPGGVRGLPLQQQMQSVHVLGSAEEWVSAARSLATRKQQGEDLRLGAQQDFALLRQFVDGAQDDFLNKAFSLVTQRRVARTQGQR